MAQPQHNYRQPFPARITARHQGEFSGGGVPTYSYSWHELIDDPATGALTRAYPGRSGEKVRAAAVEINDRKVTVPCTVWLRLRGSWRGDDLYEFVAPASMTEPLSGIGPLSGSEVTPITANLLTDACPVWTSGVLTGVKNENRLVRLPGGTYYNDPLCPVNPEGCCDMATVPGINCCWPNSETGSTTKDLTWPATMYLCPFYGVGNRPSVFDAYNFKSYWEMLPFKMTWDSANNRFYSEYIGVTSCPSVAIGLNPFPDGMSEDNIRYSFYMDKCGLMNGGVNYGCEVVNGPGGPYWTSTYNSTNLGCPSPYRGWLYSAYPSLMLPDSDRVYVEFGCPENPCHGQGFNAVLSDQAYGFETPPPYTGVVSDRQLPSSLTMTITNISGAANLAGTYTLTYGRGTYYYEGTCNGKWLWIGVHIPLSNGTPTISLHKQNKTDLKYGYQTPGRGSGNTPSVSSTEPLILSFDNCVFYDLYNFCVTDFLGGATYGYWGRFKAVISE
jgi:hypothetical protein